MLFIILNKLKIPKERVLKMLVCVFLYRLKFWKISKNPRMKTVINAIIKQFVSLSKMGVMIYR